MTIPEGPASRVVTVWQIRKAKRLFKPYEVTEGERGTMTLAKMLLGLRCLRIASVFRITAITFNFPQHFLHIAYA